MNREKRCELYFNDEMLGAYNDYVGAADDVYMKATGSTDSALFKIDDIPTDIGEWEHRSS